MTGSKIKLFKAPGKWSIRAGGAVLGETTNAILLIEDGYQDVVYFPPQDIAMAFLDRTDKKTTCPHKGEASHYSIVTKSVTLENAAWAYESPNENLAALKGYIAFYPSDRVFIEEI